MAKSKERPAVELESRPLLEQLPPPLRAPLAQVIGVATGTLGRGPDRIAMAMGSLEQTRAAIADLGDQLVSLIERHEQARVALAEADVRVETIEQFVPEVQAAIRVVRQRGHEGESETEVVPAVTWTDR